MNLLGKREPEIYGTNTYQDLVALCEIGAAGIGAKCVCIQSNHEGDIIDALQDAALAEQKADGIIINAAGYSHTSIAIADAIRAIGIPTIAVHISDPALREEYRHTDLVGDACLEVIKGQGLQGYFIAMREITKYINPISISDADALGDFAKATPATE